MFTIWMRNKQETNTKRTTNRKETNTEGKSVGSERSAYHLEGGIKIAHPFVMENPVQGPQQGAPTLYWLQSLLYVTQRPCCHTSFVAKHWLQTSPALGLAIRHVSLWLIVYPEEKLSNINTRLIGWNLLKDLSCTRRKIVIFYGSMKRILHRQQWGIILSWLFLSKLKTQLALSNDEH